MASPASSAPACAAESMPVAMPLTTVTPARAMPRPRDRATCSPYSLALRAPTTATASPAMSSRKRSRPPATYSAAGCVSQLSEPCGVSAIALADDLEPSLAGARLERRAIDGTVFVEYPLVLPAGQCTDQLAVREGEQLGQTTALQVQIPGEASEQPRALQAVPAGARAAGRAHAASASSRPRCWRSARAVRTCSRDTRSRSSRSAIVRATLSTRCLPRALSAPIA